MCHGNSIYRNSLKRRVAPRLLLLFLWLGCIPCRAAPQDAAPAEPEEFALALQTTPDVANGRRLFLLCVSCHGPRGWGRKDGAYPQIAGQLPSVIIKQLADIRAGNRANPIMRAFTSPRVLSGPQEIADLAAYIASLPMTPDNGRGPAYLVAQGQSLYKRHCAECHGDRAEGDEEDHIPLLYDQHYLYMKRQFDHIRTGRRRNADRKMTRQIQHFTRREENAVLSYVSSLRPPPEKLAPSGWADTQPRTALDTPRHSDAAAGQARPQSGEDATQ